MFNKNGFSLLSFLLYLMLFSIIALFTTHIITSLLLPSLTATRTCKSLIALHIASDLFVRDIREMRDKPHQWHIINSDEIIWHADNLDTGWCCTENRLERSTGVYNNGWRSKKTSLVAMGIMQGTFIAEKHQNHIIGIEMTLIPEIAPKKTVVCYVAVKE
jgi:type II secretory pathway component PulJ